MVAKEFFLQTQQVSSKEATSETTVRVLNTTSKTNHLEICTDILDNNHIVDSQTKSINIDADTTLSIHIPWRIRKPHLWNGRQDPFCYKVCTIILKNDTIIDQLQGHIGIRTVKIDSNKGLFLNGKHLPLRGVCRHQDRAEVGNALLPKHHKEDAQIIYEIGANAIRLAHYPQTEAFYDLMDANNSLK